MQERRISMKFMYLRSIDNMIIKDGPSLLVVEAVALVLTSRALILTRELDRAGRGSCRVRFRRPYRSGPALTSLSARNVDINNTLR